LSIADVALVAAVQPLLSYVMGVQAREAFPAVQQWVLEACQDPGVAKIMGEKYESCYVCRE
jgi:glutathione S-transferase